MMSFQVQVSAGELLDKYSILEIKRERIQDEGKLQDIQREIDVLNDMALGLITQVRFEYALLKYINRVIWDLNDVCCGLKSFDGKHIMEENNARFRIKKKINTKTSSVLSEQKSYNQTAIFVDPCESVHDFEQVHIFSQFLALYYDQVYVLVPPDFDSEARAHKLPELTKIDYTEYVTLSDSDIPKIKLDLSLIPAEFSQIMLDHKLD